MSESPCDSKNESEWKVEWTGKSSNFSPFESLLYGEKGTLLHCWWECKLIQPLWRTERRFLLKLGGHLPYDPAIPVLGIYPETATILKDTYTPAFVASLSTIARTWKLPRYPPTDEWVKTIWCIHTVEYYSALKKEWIWVSSSEADELGAYYTERAKLSQKEKILYINADIWWRRKWQPTPVLSGESQGQRSLAGHGP